MRHVSNVERLWCRLFLGLMTFCIAHSALFADSIEFMSGAKLEGKVISIDKQNRRVLFESVIAGNKRTGTYPYDSIHRVNWNGKDYVVTPRSTPRSDRSDSENTAHVERTPSDVKTLINTVGRSTPDWLSKTPLNYPNSLDLDWPLPAPKPWNSSKNIGQYIWDRINPNARQWLSAGGQIQPPRGESNAATLR